MAEIMRLISMVLSLRKRVYLRDEKNIKQNAKNN